MCENERGQAYSRAISVGQMKWVYKKCDAHHIMRAGMAVKPMAQAFLTCTQTNIRLAQ